MKKLLLAFALFLARDSFAAYASAGNILQPQTKYNTSTGYLTLDVDFSGLTTTGIPTFLSGTVTVTGNVSLTAGTARIGIFDAGGSSIVAYQGTSPWVGTGNVSLTAGTASIGTVGLNAGTNRIGIVDAGGSSVTAVISSMPNVTQGTGLPGGNTPNSWLTSDNYVAGYLTTTAGGTAPTGGSSTAWALSSTAHINITATAGFNGPCQVCVGPGNLLAALYVHFNPISTWIAPTTPLAVSTTPLCKNMGVGSFLDLSISATGTHNLILDFMPLK